MPPTRHPDVAGGIEDLFRAHSLAVDVLEPRVGSTYNVGSESGFPVREVIDACSEVSGFAIAAQRAPRRTGDPSGIVADSSRLRRELAYQPGYPMLPTIAQHAWASEQRMAKRAKKLGDTRAAVRDRLREPAFAPPLYRPRASLR